MSLKIREKAWSDFVLWCKRYGLKPFPSHPWTIAAYARWCEPRYRYPTIVGRIRAIARVHVLRCARAPDRHPIVARTLRRIELRHRSRTEHAALFPTDDAVGDTTAATKQSDKTNRTKPKKRARVSAHRLMKASPRLVSRRPAAR